MRKTHRKDGMISLRALKHAIAVADCGSFVAAARIVHLSQPALSRSVQTLEHGIGIRIFDRTAGQARATAAGELFLVRARQLTAQAEGLELETHKMRNIGESDIVVGAATYCAEGLVDIAVARLLRKRERLQVTVMTNHWVSLFQALRRREVELVVASTALADEDPRLRVEPLTHSQLYFVVRPDHPLAARQRVALADILRFPVATTSRVTSPNMEMLLKAASPGKQDRLRTIACESLAMIKGILRGSDAIAFLPLRAMLGEIRSGALALLPLRPPWLRGRFGIVTLRECPQSEVAQGFVEILKEVDVETEALAREEERRTLGSAQGEHPVAGMTRHAREQRAARQPAARRR
jgi:DNA-binding transcriptional LysR family regulator